MPGAPPFKKSSECVSGDRGIHGGGAGAGRECRRMTPFPGHVHIEEGQKDSVVQSILWPGAGGGLGAS